MSDQLTPFQVCERMLGSASEIALICGFDRTAAYAWRNSPRPSRSFSAKSRDPGDLPSSRIQRRLLAHAAARGIPLTADHLIWGAPAAEIDALLAASLPAEAAE